MSLYQDVIYTQACGQCKQIADAISECESAKNEIDNQICAIETSWQSIAGQALLEKLSVLKTSLSSSVEALRATYAQMQRETASAYDLLRDSAMREAEAVRAAEEATKLE